MDNNYRTLHKDIGLIQRTNNGWDLWFDNGDTVRAEGFHSLQVGIIIACLTSWNYMNRYGNPTYEIFGNRAYQLLKSNKSSMTAYKIQQFFLECLKRMRRIYDVVSLEVYEVEYEPHKYFVEFEVISINNQLVDGSFTVATDTSKSSSFISYDTFMPYASNTNPLTIDLYLQNEYGGGLEGEILYMYLKKGDGDYEFIGVTDKTDKDGYVRFTYTPTDNYEENVIYFDFKGNTTHNPTTSKRTIFKSEIYDYDIQFMSDGEVITTYETSIKENHINIRLFEISQLTEERNPKTQATMLIKGTDGSVYETITNFEGIATVVLNPKESYVTYTAYYGDETSDCIVTVVPRQSMFQATINKSTLHPFEEFTINAILTDSLGNPIKDYPVKLIDNGEVLVESKTNKKGEVTFSNHYISCGEHTLSVLCNSSVYYLGDNYSFNVNVEEYSYNISSIHLFGYAKNGHKFPMEFYDYDVGLDESIIMVADIDGVAIPNIGLLEFMVDGEVFDTQEIISNGSYSSRKYNVSSLGEHTISVQIVPNENCENILLESEEYTLPYYTIPIRDEVSLEFTGDRFNSFSDSPFTFNGSLIIDWGDGTVEEYTGGRLSHTYDTQYTYKIYIYGQITRIGIQCFYNCTGLTSITIPESVTKIGNSCFNNCTGLTNITIPESVTSLGADCFRGCSSLTSITIPSSVTSLRDSCFNGCSSLTSITIPEGVTKMGHYCFDNCTGLTSISIPSSVTSIGYYCFRGCINLEVMRFNWTTNPLTYNSNWFANIMPKLIVPHNSLPLYYDADYPIPVMELTITGDSFNSYNDSPFTFNESLLIDWGDDTGLIEYSGGNLSHNYDSSDDYTVKVYGYITSLGNGCFDNCTGLTSISIPSSVTSLGNGCFYNCSSLTSITIPESVTSLGDSCFSYCTGLTSITIPESVTKMGHYCFSYCTGLTSITIPSSVTSLRDSCFRGCSSLTSINLPSSVTSIGDSCFRACSSLTSITIPESVTSLGADCFYSCTGLTSIILQWNNPPQNYNNTWIIHSPAIFSIPQNTRMQYINANYPTTYLVERSQ